MTYPRFVQWYHSQAMQSGRTVPLKLKSHGKKENTMLTLSSASLNKSVIITFK